MRPAAALLAVLGLLALPSGARAVATLAEGPGDGLLAVAAGTGSAYAVVGSGDPARPFTLVRSSGRGASLLGRFGTRGAVFPDVAAGPAGVLVAHGVRTSDGLRYESSLAASGRLGSSLPLAASTGPARIALNGRARVAAFPDSDGDAVIGGVGPEGAPLLDALTATGPERRHFPLDLIYALGRPLVLDLDQSGSRSDLRVLGAGVPTAPVLSVPGVRALEATIAADKERIYVAYRAGEDAVLASAPMRPDGIWKRRRLRTRGAVGGAPAVVRVGLRTIVATSERIGSRRDLFVRTIGPAGTFTDRLTRTGGADVGPRAAAGPDDAVYVGWTRRAVRGTPAAALLERVA